MCHLIKNDALLLLVGFNNEKQQVRKFKFQPPSIALDSPVFREICPEIN